MCGLCGYAGLGANKDALDAFKDLLWCSATRGKDGTGVATVGNTYFRKPLVETYKKALSSPNFFFDSCKGTGKWPHKSTHDVVIGHCRDMTRGVKTDEDSHPFTFRDITGAHNGTLSMVDYNEKGRSDSAQMFEDMSLRGVIPVLEDLSYFSAYAVSIWDNHNKKLFLSRNIDRPLTVAIGMKTSVLFWASEYRMLQACLERAGRMNGKNNLGKFEYLDLTPGTVYMIEIDKIKSGNITPWTTVDLKKKEIPKFQGWDSTSSNLTISTLQNNKPPFDIPAFLDRAIHQTCVHCGDILEGPEWNYDPIWHDNQKKFACFSCEPNQVYNTPKQKPDGGEEVKIS